MARVEGGVLATMASRPCGQRGARLGQVLPAVGRRGAGSAVGANGAWSITLPGMGNDVVVWGTPHRIARGAVERRPLAARPLSQHAAQPQKDEDRQRQEDDGVDVNTSYSLSGLRRNGLRRQNRSGRCRSYGNGKIYITIGRVLGM